MRASKETLRARCWAALRQGGAARFPGTEGRIPNFRGAERAARRLASTDVWRSARVIKCNPDAPQLPVRRAALEAGKTVYLAVPRLRDRRPFVRLDPAGLDPGDLRRAASIRGATALGRPVAPHQVRRLDLVVTGCVGATREGARLGKGGGYSDLEYGLLREEGKIGPDTPVVTTLHPLQLLPDGGIPVEPHDISLDRIVLPDEAIECPRPFARPGGIVWELLDEERIAAIPALERRRGRARRAGRRGGRA